MAKKKEMTMGQRVILKSHGYSPTLFEVLFDYPQSMIIRSLDKKEAAIIFKDPHERLMGETETN